MPQDLAMHPKSEYTTIKRIACHIPLRRAVFSVQSGLCNIKQRLILHLNYKSIVIIENISGTGYDIIRREILAVSLYKKIFLSRRTEKDEKDSFSGSCRADDFQRSARGFCC